MIKNKINKLIIGVFAIFVGIMNTSAAADVGYPVFEQRFDGLDAWCIDANYSPISSTSGLSQCNISEIKGQALINAKNLGDYNKTQLAMRLIGYNAGLSKSPKKVGINIKNGIYNTPTFKEVYNAYSKAGSDVTVAGGVVKFAVSSTQNGQDYTITVNIEGPAGVHLTIKDENDNVWGTGTGKFSITKTLKGEECKGIQTTLYAYGINASSGANQSCTPTSDTFYYYNCGKGLQNYIIYVPGGHTIPGRDCDGNDNGQKATALGTYDISIPDRECDCSAEYSGDFVCDGSGSNSEYLRETDSILSCIISGNYQKYCGSSIEKMNDNNGSINKTDKLSNKVDEYKIDLNNNPYCKVYCKEDITYDLPGKIEVKNGTYFTLNDGVNVNGASPIRIEGTRSCYTDEIDIEKFKSEVKEAQKDVVSAYKDYKEAEAKLKSQNNAGDAEKSSCAYNGICGATGSDQAGTDGEWYTGSEETYYYYDLTLNDNGTLGSLVPKNDKVKEEWGTKYTATSTASCNIGSETRPKYSNGTSCSKTTKKQTKIDLEEYKQEVKEKQDKLNKILKNYKSCYEWNNNYCFEPKVVFDYEDGKLYTELNDKELVSNESKNESKEFMYKNISSDEQYNADGTTMTKPTEKEYVYFNFESASLGSQGVRVNLEQNFVKKVSIKERKYTHVDVKVCTYHPYGTIVTGDNCNDGHNKLLLGDGYVFPVSLQNKEKRQENYNLKFSNIGVAGNDASCDNAQANRLMGCDNPSDVYSVETQKTEPKYTCQYSSCPECEVECVCPPNTPNCYVEDKECKYVECPTCNVSCIGCLWNDGNATFAYKSISLTEVFANGGSDKAGYNWNTNNEINPQSDKASQTINDIEKEAEKAYKKPEYSYTLSPSTMGKIRKYNEEANKSQASSEKWGNKTIPNGGYNNDTLTCKNGEKCTSSFLDGLDANATNKRSDEWKVFKNGKWTIEK